MLLSRWAGGIGRGMLLSYLIPKIKQSTNSCIINTELLCFSTEVISQSVKLAFPSTKINANLNT